MQNPHRSLWSSRFSPWAQALRIFGAEATSGAVSCKPTGQFFGHLSGMLVAFQSVVYICMGQWVIGNEACMYIHIHIIYIFIHSYSMCVYIYILYTDYTRVSIHFLDAFG